LVAWLESHGLQVETVSKGRTSIAFSGTVSQVEEAFHTSIHSFLLNGGQADEQQFTSNTTDPRIPAALANVVKGVAHLNTIEPRPFSVRGNLGRMNPQTRRLEPANGPTPYLTQTGPDFLYLVPGDAATIYDTPNSYNANFSSGTSYTGAGVKIGVGGDATISASVVADYRSLFLGNSTQPILNYCTSSSSCSATAGSGYNKNDADEAYIDTELSGGNLLLCLFPTHHSHRGGDRRQCGGHLQPELRRLRSEHGQQQRSDQQLVGAGGDAGHHGDSFHRRQRLCRLRLQRHPGQRRIAGERLCLHAV
jgi:subtilase family serine protease